MYLLSYVLLMFNTLMYILLFYLILPQTSLFIFLSCYNPIFLSIYLYLIFTYKIEVSHELQIVISMV